MHIIAFGDIHMATGGLAAIPGIKTADLVLANGDLSNRGGRAEARTVLDAILVHNPRLLAQFGNFDRPEVDGYLQDLDINLHGQARMVGGEVCLVGLGGANPTPFNTPSEFDEEELLAIATRAMEQGREFVELAEPLYRHHIPLILVSHAPPRGTLVDRLHNGRHVGSSAVRAIIERYQPELCIAGHIHEGRGIDHIGKTPVYNPGALVDGHHMAVSVDNAALTPTLS